MIDKALARDPDQRYPSVTALWAAVREAAAEAPSGRARKLERLARWAWGLVIALMLAGIIGVFAHSFAQDREGEPVSVHKLTREGAPARHATI